MYNPCTKEARVSEAGSQGSQDGVAWHGKDKDKSVLEQAEVV